MEYVREHVDDPRRVDYRPMNAFLLPPPWYRGRALVIGDAAHTTTPHLATGAGIAIEDAVVLAELIATEPAGAELLEAFMSAAVRPLPPGGRDGGQARRDGEGQPSRSRRTSS